VTGLSNVAVHCVKLCELDRLIDVFWKSALLVALPGLLLASEGPQPPTSDPLKQGLWWLYHIQYDKAYAAVDRYISAHPEDPTGHFYKTAIAWWHLAQELDKPLPDVEKQMELDYQATVKTAKALYESAQDDATRAKACLYWGGAEGLKGRWLVTQKQWVKAYFLGKRGDRLLHKALAYDPETYDAYLGLGIYDYFTDTLGGVQKVLAAILIRGDKQRGIGFLEQAIEKAPHARVEAMFFLVEIYSFEEKQPEKALPILQALRKEFPASPAVELAEITTLYQMKAWDRVIAGAEDFLKKSQEQMPWFKKEGVFPAWYCLGVGMLQGRNDAEKAATYFSKILSSAEETSRWRTFAMLRLGQIMDLRAKRPEAVDYYKQVLARPDFWGSHQEAHDYLKTPYSNPVQEERT